MIAARIRRLTAASRAIGAFVVLVGAVVLAGWHFDIAVLKSIVPQFVTMKVNTAICFVLAGVLLLLSTAPDARAQGGGRFSRVLSGLMTIVGAATLVEYMFGADFGIDQLLYRDVQSPHTPDPGRMSPATAINFVLIGIAFLSLDVRVRGRYFPSQWLVLLVLTIGYIAIMGYAYDVSALYGIEMYTSVAVHTAALFVLLPIGILIARPEHGFMQAIVADTASGVLLRRLLPLAILLPPLVDWLQVHAPGVDDNGYRISLAAMIIVVFLITFAWWTARSVRLAEDARRIAEATAKTGEERLHIALQAAGGGAWDWDLTTNIAWWSPEMYALWDVAPGTIMRLDNSVAAIHEADRETVNTAVANAIAARKPYHCEFRLNRPERDGERWMASRGRVIFDAAGNPARLVGISLDITAQKRTERELRMANEALERSNIELRRFAHVASHDLQTPMRSVASFAELLQTKYAGKFDAQADDWLNRIVQSVSHLRTLVRDLLHYARVDSEPKPFAPVDLRRIVDRVSMLLDSPIRESSAQVTSDDLPVVMGDATQLAELLLNLIGNALKYRGDAPPRVHVSAARDAQGWRICVRDNGIGIDPRHHERIFEVFARLHTQQQFPGTGIGLAICRRVVQHHGGRIWVESAPGQGSVFCFTLPDRE